jgi:transposase
LLARLDLPAPWAGNVAASLALIDDLEAQIDACEQQLRRLGADHPDIRLLDTAPGIAWVLGSTIAADLGGIARFASPKRGVWLHRGVPQGGPVRPAATTAARSPPTARPGRAGR